jgi:ABC-type glycerol-3-phosphate transport system substrate-binding protein
LQSAPPVAPSILPDITLLDRDALADAGHARLIVPVRNLTGLAALANLFPAAREVGAIDGNLTGLAYLLEVDQTIYRQSVFRTPPESFGQVLESGQLFAFLAGASSGVSPVILLQYLAAGGKLVDDGGQPALDASPLAQVLSFYGQAKIRGNVTPELFQLPDQASVWGLYRARQTNLAAVTSTQVITGLDQVSGSKLGAIPTADGKLYTLARGWSWVVVTHDLDRQAAAIALLNFLMNPVNHSQYSQAAHWLPSQPAALAMWSSEDGNLVAFATSLLTNAHAMPDSATRGSPGAAMQTALEAVILNGASPAQAAGHAADLVKAGQGRAP